MTLTTYDLFTDAELEIYQELISKINELKVFMSTLKPRERKVNEDYLR